MQTFSCPGWLGQISPSDAFSHPYSGSVHLSMYSSLFITTVTLPLLAGRILILSSFPGGVRHDPQRFMGKTVTVPHFNRDTVEFASLKRNESNPGIKTLLPFPKITTEESDFENFQDLIVALDACYWLHKAISIGLSRFGDDRRCHKSSRF